MVKKVLVVDDHPIVREGIAQLFARQPDLCVVGNAVDTASARQAVRTCAPDVALVDLSLGRESGLDLIPLLRQDAPALLVLALSMHDEALYAKRALQAGARGYIMKHEGTDLLLHAIRTVLAGEVYVSARINATFLRSLTDGRQRQPAGEPRTPLGELSNRELQIYRLVGHGLSTKEIAHQLFLSAKTVETHRGHIKQKLGLETSAALVAHAAEWLFRSGHTFEGAAPGTATAVAVDVISGVVASGAAEPRVGDPPSGNDRPDNA
jgi:DNA-binding NarL/FixJ family response regulator